MNFGKRRVRHAALATGAAVLASLTLSAGGPPGSGQDDSPVRTPPVAAKDDGAPERTSPGKGRTIRVRAQLLVGEELDLGAPGRSVGDQFVFSGNLFQTRGSDDRALGRFGGFCVITDLERNSGECSMTAVLRGGQIAVQGEQTGIPTPRRAVNAITGGTGEFRGAQGQVRIRALTPATWDLTFQLTGR